MQMPREPAPRVSLGAEPTKQIAVDWNDELVKATNLTRDGKVVHPAFSGEAAKT